MSEASTKEKEKKMLERRKEGAVEKWRPFEDLDKFRQPGFWRGDDQEIRRNPVPPSTRPPRQSLLEQIPLNVAMERVAMEGRYGDTELAHITPEEKITLAMNGGANTINPDTGIAEFYPEENATMAEDEPASILAEKDMSSTKLDKATVEELKAIRDMIREAKASGKSEDKKTLKEITKRHKLLLENLINGNAVKEDVKGIPLDAAVKRVAEEGRGGDTMVAHIMPEEAELLKAMGGSGTINPKTGLREFDVHGTGSYGNDTGPPDTGPVGGEGGKDEGDRGRDAKDAAAPNAGPFGSSGGAIPGYQGEAEIADQRNTPITSYSASMFPGILQDPLGWVGSKVEGFANQVSSNPFGTIGGLIAGMAVSSFVGPAVAGVLGSGIAGAVGGKVAGSYVGSQVNDLVANSVNSNSLTSSTNPNSTAPTTTVDPTAFNGDPANSRGTGPSNYDQRIAPLTSAQVNPLAVQPTTTVADDTTTSNPFSSGIYIPPIGAPTAGRPLQMNT